jgi:hypothetical protein
MSAFARSKRPATLSRLRRGDRVVAVLATVIAPALVWLIATVGFGQNLYQPGFGGSAPQELSIWLVAAIAGIAALAGAGVLALITRTATPARLTIRSPRPTSPARTGSGITPPGSTSRAQPLLRRIITRSTSRCRDPRVGCPGTGSVTSTEHPDGRRR